MTDRLILKNIGKEDTDFILSHFSDRDVTKYLYDTEPLTDISGANEIICSYLETEPRSQNRWILVRKTDNEKIGTCGFHCWNRNEANVEIGYDLQREFWSKGYMQEALIEILNFAKGNMNVMKIEAHVYVENIKSINLLGKIGFKISGTKNELFRGKEYLHNIYTLSLG
jgi:ribosomal-protein-alanine N-acetyltransferase